ncbi:transposase [Francisella sp. 19X1-34]|uniref:transposase n=1 Tax=Francisella sp. 19X1-34 TaxID=3087177 RepID=UPI002E2F5783|nr:transposase [Francisella sp. 19X1-34]MED7787765.1 transposase [Francisella sp. 19X1-34]
MLVKNKGFGTKEIILLVIFVIIIIASIFFVYLKHNYTTRLSNEISRLDLLKTRVSTELIYGNGTVEKQSSKNGLYALVNISANKSYEDIKSQNTYIRSNGQIIARLDDRSLGKGSIVLTPYVKSRHKVEDPYIIWDCLIITNKNIPQFLMPDNCIVKSTLE